MFSWKKNSELGRANIVHLREYYRLVTSTKRGIFINEGDYVCFESYPFIADSCATSIVPDKTEEIYGYVLKLDPNESSEYLGRRRDIKIATVYNNKVIVKFCDSRLFHKISSSCPEIPKLLIEFVNDTPISEVKLGTFVRPRIHFNIEHDFTQSFTSVTKPFSSPLIVLRSNGDKVILAGSMSSVTISEICVDRDLICQYEESR